MTAANRDIAWGGSGGGGPPVFPPVESLDDLTLAGNLGVKGGRPWFDVKAFGALADGVTDDTAAFVAALSAASSGGVVYAPLGTYKLTSSSALPVASYLNQVAIIGAGIGRTRINYSGSGYCFTVGDGTASRAFGHGFRDMTIDCSASSAPSGCVSFSASHFGFVDHCELIAPSGGAKTCINFDPGTGTPDNYFHRITGCRIAGTTQASDVGIRLPTTTAAGRGAGSNYIQNNWLAGFNQCILIDGGHSNVITANEFNGSSNSGIVIQNTAQIPNDNKIIGNHFDGPTTAINVGSTSLRTLLLGNTPNTMSVIDNGTDTIRLDGGVFKYSPANNLQIGAGLTFLGTSPSLGMGAFTAGTIANVALFCQVAGEANTRFFMRGDGTHQWGAGGASAVDLSLSRSAADVLSLGTNDVLKTGQNVTGSRPAAATVGKGSQFYDTTLNKPIWSDGANWKDAAGTIV